MDEKRKSRLDFTWRYSPQQESNDALLLSYIKHNPVQPTAEMILMALRAFWLPSALEAAGNFAEAQRAGQFAAHTLELQAVWVRYSLGLELLVPPTPTRIAPTGLVGANPQPLSPTPASVATRLQPKKRASSDARKPVSAAQLLSDSGGGGFDGEVFNFK